MVLHLCRWEMVLIYLQVFSNHGLGCENKSLRSAVVGMERRHLKNTTPPKVIMWFSFETLIKLVT